MVAFAISWLYCMYSRYIFFRKSVWLIENAQIWFPAERRNGTGSGDAQPDKRGNPPIPPRVAEQANHETELKQADTLLDLSVDCNSPPISPANTRA